MAIDLGKNNDLGCVDSSDFERRVVSIFQQYGDLAEGHNDDLLVRIISLVDASEALSSREKERRLIILVKKFLSQSPVSFIKIAVAAKDLSPVVKNALKSFLPPECLPLMYGRPEPTQQTLTSEVSLAIREGYLPSPISKRVEYNKGSQDQGESDWNVVLLLGTNAEHESNLSILRKEFAPVRVADQGDLEKLLDQRICCIVVGSSWWTLIDPAKYEAFIYQISSYSHLAYLKINHKGMPDEIAKNIPSILREARFKTPSVDEVSFSETLLSPLDLEIISKIKLSLSAVKDIRIHPAAISDEIGHLLLAATLKRVDGLYADTSVTIRKVDCLFLHGNSGSLILLIQPSAVAAPFIAKVDKANILRKEMKRFNKFIRPWDTQLYPEYFVHGRNAVIIFGLVGDAGQPGTPAPTLHDRIESFYWSDLCGEDVNTAEANLQTAISRAVRKIEDLAKRANATDDVSLGWIKCESLQNCLSRGIQWSFSNEGTDLNVDKVLKNVIDILDKLKDVATIHGDVHLKNILLNDDLHPYLIDYAYSGPGHPCYDLVRLESAITFTFFRMLDGEARVEEMIQDITLSDITYTQLCQKYGNLLSLGVNRLAGYSAIEARNAALRSVIHYGGSQMDYLAMKLMVAFQSLTIFNLQQCVVRATISAISPKFQ